MTAGIVLSLGLTGIFVALALLLSTVGSIASERQQVGRSLAALRAIEVAPGSMKSELEVPFTTRVLLPTFARLTRLGRALTAAGQVNRMKRRLDLAGNPVGWDVDRVLAFKVVGLVAGVLLGGLATFALGMGLLSALGLTIAVTLAGFFTPDLVLYQKGYNRTEQMRRELPDALDLLSISVEAGLGFDAALSQVARNTTGPLADEFFRVLQEMQIGTGRAAAMKALGERTDLPELRGFVTSMVQADSFGIPVANVLRVQAAEMRVKRSQLAEERAQKVPVKILFPLIFCVLPQLFIVILGPAAITIYKQFFQHGFG
jgi:tight adherence protein C